MAELVAKLKMEDGGFSSGIASATSSLQKLDKQATLSKRGLDNFFKGQGTDAMKTAFDGVSRTLSNLEKKMGSASTGMNQQFKAMRAAARELEWTFRNLSDAEKQSAAGQELRAHIDELIAKSGELKDTIGDTDAAIKFAASDTAQLDAFAQGLTALSAGAQVATGAMSLFGVSEEKAAAIQQTIITLIGITNGLQTIQNALQKESNLMQFISIARTKGLAVALGLRAAAQTASTGAITAETGAVEANTAAWAMNPIGAIIVVVLAAVAAVVALTSALNDNTAAVEGEREAVEEATNAEKEGWKTYIKTQFELDNLKKSLDNYCGSKEDEKRLVQDLNNKYGDALGYYNSVAEWKAALTEISYYYCKQLKEEAKLQALVNAYGEAYAAMMTGEDFDKNKAKIEKLDALIDDAQFGVQLYSDMVKRLIPKANRVKPSSSGGHSGSSSSGTKKQTQAQRQATKADKERQTALENLNKEIAKYQKLYDSVKDKDGKGQQKAQQYESNILDLQKQKLNYLKKGTDEYANQLKKIQTYYGTSSKEWKEYEKLIKDNEIQKLSDNLDALDLSIPEESEQALSIIKQIIGKFAEGSKELETWEQKFKEMFPHEYWTDRLDKLQKKLKTPGVDVEAINDEIEDAQDHINKLNIQLGIEEAPMTDYEKGIDAYNRWLKDVARNSYLASDGMTDFNKKISEQQAKLDELVKQRKMTAEQAAEEMNKFMDEQMNNLPNVIVSRYTGPDMTGIARYWQDVISDLDKQLNENDLDVEARLKLLDDKAEAQRKLDNILKGELTIPAKIKPEFVVKGSAEDMRQSYQNLLQEAQDLQNDYSIGLIDYKKFQEDLKQINKKVEGLHLKPIKLDIESPIEEKLNNIKDQLSNFNSITGVVDSFQELTDKINENANAWDIFKASISTVENIISGILSVMQIIKAVKEATIPLTEKETQQSTEMAADKIAEAGAQGAIVATSPGVVAAMEAQAAAAGTALPTLKELTGTMLELAAATMFNANASIPIVGAAIGAANVAIMTATMSALKALTSATAFANGGIVGGSSWHGDKIYARVNSGEAILNKRQQSNLFRLIDGGHPLGNGSANVEFKIKGSELIGVIKNYEDKHSKLR